jgi:hypothetical protein
MGEWNAQNSPKEFEGLIRDAIAILVQRGEIKIPQKKPSHPPNRT